MGYIKFYYSIHNNTTAVEDIVNELEYGNTFRLYLQKEIIIPLRLGNLKWIKWKYSDALLILEVNDDFFDKSFFFEKVLTSFIYNLQDFGEIKLEKIDLNKSIFKKIFMTSFFINNSPLFEKNELILGTIIKPYYHLSLKEKIHMTTKFFKYGFKVIKNDECYFASGKDLINETKIIQQEILDSSYYIPNVTHLITDYSSIERLIKAGIKIVMINVLVTGFKNIYLLKMKFPELKIWGHRVGYAQLSNIISMDALSILLTLAGVDFLHIGTPVTKIEINNRIEIMNINQKINSCFRPVFTKTTPEVNSKIIKQFKNNPIYLGCGYFRDKNGKIDWGKVDFWQKEANKQLLQNLE